MLKGTIFITPNINIIYNTPLNGNTRVVSLDEDGVLGDNKDIISGVCLLPPIEAKIAEADGNERAYDAAYANHLLLPFQQKFIAALIAYLYKGGNLILFLPEIGYTNTMDKLVEHLFRAYGIHVGIIGATDPKIANCYYDAKCIPIWLNLIFSSNVISAYEYLYMYPVDAKIQNQNIMNLLLMQMNPYGETINDKIDYILRFHQKIHVNPKLIQAIESI